MCFVNLYKILLNDTDHMIEIARPGEAYLC